MDSHVRVLVGSLARRRRAGATARSAIGTSRSYEDDAKRDGRGGVPLVPVVSLGNRPQWLARIANPPHKGTSVARQLDSSRTEQLPSHRGK